MADIVRSKVYKDSSEVPINGGQLEVRTSEFDRSLDTSFRGISDVNSFEIVSNSGSVTYQSNEGFVFGDNVNNSLEWKSISSYNLNDHVINVECGINIYGNGVFDSVYRFRANNGNGEEISLVYDYDSVNDNYNLELSFSSSSSSHDFSDAFSIDENLSISSRFIFDAEDNTVFCFVYKNDEWSLLKKFDIPSYSTQSDKNFNFYVGCFSENSLTVNFKDFNFLPTVKGAPDQTFERYLNNLWYNSSYEVFDLKPQYPGDFELKIFGSGKNIGSRQYDEIKVLNSDNTVSETTFMSTPVKDYRVDSDSTSCPNSLTDVDGSAVNFGLSCFCDSSDKFSVRINEGGRLKKAGKDFVPYENSTPYPSIKVESDGKNYGRNFDISDFGIGVSFDDISNLVSNASEVINEGTIRVCNSLVMSNNDICYYGIVCKERKGVQNINFDFTEVMGANDYGWEIGDARTGEVITSNISFSSGSANLPVDLELEPGFYYYTVQGGDGKVYDGDKSDGNILIQTDDIESEYGSLWDDGKQDHKMFFRVKEYRGYPFVVYYDFCEGTFVKDIIESKECSLRTNSISALETADENVSLIYEELKSDDIWNNKSKKLKYQKFDVSNGSFNDTGYISFPRSLMDPNEFIHSFDFELENRRDTGDDVKFILTADNERSSFFPVKSNFRFFSPFLSTNPSYCTFTVDNFGFDFSLVFDGSDIDLSSVRGNVNVLNMDSLINLYLKSVDTQFDSTNMFVESYIDISMNHKMYPFTADFLDLQYDEDRGGLLLSVLNYRNRCPYIKYISGDREVEVSVPRFFDFYADGDATVLNNYNSDPVNYTSMRYTDIGSISSCFSTDGLIYSLAVRDHTYPYVSSVNSVGIDAEYVHEKTPIRSYLDSSVENVIESDGGFLEVGDTFLLNNDVFGPFSKCGNDLNGLYSVDSVSDLMFQDILYIPASGSNRSFSIEYTSPDSQSPLEINTVAPVDTEKPVEIEVSLATDQAGDLLQDGTNVASNIANEINANISSSYVKAIPNGGLGITGAILDIVTSSNGNSYDLTSSTDVSSVGGVDLLTSKNQRILLKDQNDSTENGFYDTNSSRKPDQWTRFTNYDDSSEIKAGTYAKIKAGDLKGQFWIQSNSVSSVGSDDIIFKRENLSITTVTLQQPKDKEYSKVTVSRVNSYDQSSEINYGDLIYVKNGQKYGDSRLVLIKNDPIELGETFLRYIQLSGDKPWEERNSEIALINSNRIKSNEAVVTRASNRYISASDQNVSEVVASFKDDIGKPITTIPVFNMYGDSDYRFNKSQYVYGDITRFMNYHLISLGSDINSEKVLTDFSVLNTYDNGGFEVPADEVLESSYKSNSFYDLSNVSYRQSGSLSEYIRLESLYSKPSVSRQLDDQGTREDNKRSRYADEGYRFRIDFEPILNGGNFSSSDRFEENFVFEAECYGKMKFGKLTKSKVQMVYDGVNVDCRVLDPESGLYNSVGYIKSVDNQRVQEFDIIVHHSSQLNKSFNVVFLVKDKGYINEAVKADSHPFNFVSDTKINFGKGILEDVSFDSSIRTNFSCYFDNDYKDYNDYVNIYKMSWNKSDLDTDVQANNVVDRSFDLNTGQINKGYLSLPGEQFYNFNDSEIYSYNSKLFYPYNFKLSQASSNSDVSFNHHWPSGYLFRLTRGSGVCNVNERFDLDFEENNDISNLSKDNLHSFYTSSDDLSEMIVYCDSTDHDIKKFLYDTCAIKGINIPKFDILYRDDPNLSWSKLKTVDISEHKISKSRVNSLTNFKNGDQNKVLIELENANFDRNDFFEFDYYLWDGNFLIGKVSSVRGNKIVLDTNNDWFLSNFGEKFSIFPNSYVDDLDNRKNRQVGVRFNDNYGTYEGLFTLNFLDFGRDTVIPIEWNNDIGSGSEFSVQTSVDYVYDTQSFSIDDTYYSKQFNLQYSVLEKNVLEKIRSLNQEIGYNRKPLYVFEGKESHPEKVYLCFFSEDLSYNVLRSWGGEEYYEASMRLRSIE